MDAVDADFLMGLAHIREETRAGQNISSLSNENRVSTLFMILTFYYIWNVPILLYLLSAFGI